MQSLEAVAKPSAVLKQDLEERLKKRGIPAAPSVLKSLLEEFEAPPESRNLDKIVNLVSCDAVLTARCLGLANSPLFGLSRRIVNVRSAVVALGAKRLKDLLISACLMQINPRSAAGMTSLQIWEHAFASALMARRLALEIEYPEPDKVYLSALLHDIGHLVNMLCFPKEFAEAVKLHEEKELDLFDAEKQVLGFTHCDSGFVLGDLWQLPEEAKDAIAYHHEQHPPEDRMLFLALIQMGDALAQWYGFDDGNRAPDMPSLMASQNWKLLSDLAREATLDDVNLVSMFGDYANEVKSMVSGLMHA
jgi:HD-like signal output (HDOD) protein